MKKLLILGLLLQSTFALAAIQAVQEGTKADEIAGQASGVFQVYNFHAGDFAYKIVEMDTMLNGDLNATTMVLVGFGEVGGAAGYEKAFQLTPTEDLWYITSARVVKNEIEVHGRGMDGNERVYFLRYDPKKGVLRARK